MSTNLGNIISGIKKLLEGIYSDINRKMDNYMNRLDTWVVMVDLYKNIKK